MNTIKSTLIELVIKNFVEISKKKKVGNKRAEVRNKFTTSTKLSISSILINLKINEAILRTKEEKSDKEDLEDPTEEEPEDKKERVVHGGYGTIKPYSGMSPYTNYANYDKIWGHIGTFRSQSMYEKPMDGFFPQNDGKSTGVLVDNKVIEQVVRHFKYFIAGDVIGDVGYVPPAGANIDSKDWEKYRLMSQMSIYRPLLALFRAIA